jgi:transposase
MGHSKEIFVGIDVAKLRNAVAVADGTRGGEVRFLGEVDASEESMRRVVKRITRNGEQAHFCYEAGPTGYGLHRLITSLGHSCTVVAPSLIPRKAGDRIKTNRRDAVGLAKLLRAGELTAVRVPDKSHEAMRYLRWLQKQKFDHPAHQIALQEMVEAVRIAKERVQRLEGRSRNSCRNGHWRQSSRLCKR